MALGLTMIGPYLEDEGNDKSKRAGAARELNCQICISILPIITNHEVYIFHLKI